MPCADSNHRLGSFVSEDEGVVNQGQADPGAGAPIERASETGQ
jgi:hypothetical protein